MNTPGFDISAILHDITNAIGFVEWKTWIFAIIYVLVGFLLAGQVSKFIGRVLQHHTSAHYTIIIKRMFYYGIITISVVLALAALHLDVHVLGIATLFTLAIGFASQTAVSNIISGLFLVFEQPFVVGDYIEYNHISGELLSIDLLSVKILTNDNSLIRIPNEQLLKNQFINLTRFPTRRLEIKLRVSMQEDLDKVRKVLLEVAAANTKILKNPAPKFLFEEFNEAAYVFKFGVWVHTGSYDEVKHGVTFEIQKAFVANDIKLPVTHYLQVDTKA